jgi:Uncharacterized conserved protein
VCFKQLLFIYSLLHTKGTYQRYCFMGVILLVLIIISSGCGKLPESETKVIPTQYGEFICATYETLDVSSYNMIVIDAAYYSIEEISALHDKGVIVYSYLNVGTIEDFRDFYFEYQHFILGEYEDWPGEYWIDVSKEEWQTHIYEFAGMLVEKGIDGFFIDNTDVYYHYHNEDIFLGLITILNRLNEYEKEILINGGDVFVSEAILEVVEPLIQISGVNQECVFTRINFENSELSPQNKEDTNYYQEYLEKCRNKNLKVYLLEYTSDERLIRNINEYCRTWGFEYYISSSVDLQ